VTIAVLDVDGYLAGPYVSALQTAALQAGQPDPFTTHMTDVVNLIRSAVRGGCIRNHTPVVVSMTPLSVPPELRGHALALIVESMQGRLARAGVTLGLEEIKASADRARKYIERIQDGLALVTTPPDPLTPDDQQRGGPIQIVRREKRLYTRRQTRGLL
jgi:hypothetical protein